jgi:hypothetical protein
VHNERAVAVAMGRLKGAKNDYDVIRDGLRGGLGIN